MEFLATAMKTLVFLGIVFFIAFSYTCFLWSERKIGLSSVFGACVIALLNTLKILWIGSLFLIVAYIASDFFK